MQRELGALMIRKRAMIRMSSGRNMSMGDNNNNTNQDMSLKRMLEKATGLVVDAMERTTTDADGSQANSSMPNAKECEYLLSAFPSTLPQSGLGAMDALSVIANPALNGAARLDSAGYFGHMDPRACDESIAATLMMVSSNQNLLHPDAAPSARKLERMAVEVRQ